MDCVFCKIIKGEIPAEKVYEDENFLAFLDIKPVSTGHLLLIPKEHYPTFLEMPEEIIQKIMIRAKHLMEAIKKATVADFVILSVVGIEIPHFHIHLIPRHKNDGLANFWPTKKYSNNEAKIIAEKIKENLNLYGNNS